MRSTGVVDSARGLGRHDHLCWGYEHHQDFRDEALVFVDEGLRQGQRILYTGENDLAGLRAELDGIVGLERLVDDGAVHLVPLLATYEAVHAHEDQAQVYAAATRDAIRAGYTGLRTVADATVLVLDPTARDTFVRYEHRIDRLMAGGLPFSAMCGYDRHRLGDAAVGEIGCVHPLIHDASTAFQVHAHDGGATLRLAGDVDAWHEVAVEHAFRRTFAAADSGRGVVVDCADLGFTHHRALEAMHRAARAAHVQVCVVHATPTVAAMVDLLHLDTLRVDTT
jgi:anti-anti-sigma regulatory factor